VFVGGFHIVIGFFVLVFFSVVIFRFCWVLFVVADEDSEPGK